MVEYTIHHRRDRVSNVTRGMSLMDGRVATGACPEHATSHPLRLLPMFLEWTSREFQRRIRSGSVGAKSADLLRQSIAIYPNRPGVMVKEAKEKEGEYPLQVSAPV
ncbi:hypothetical protein PCH_Pc21g19230 [Penicillium rubens Wisconsin 54-1255]|uniref:Uncharacterized protein n=1 Tax=Penicillium rubens (strain ATCC 28089 / DSM 1075 / NRRL 1951 / Wisconsin 54-1255) TaxID=500485 RepID=B6HJ35_PENRW|nr:hypothetical protein PCH_Pc21g19230 [Penicillium rubens Wisconsin 54-1255]